MPQRINFTQMGRFGDHGELAAVGSHQLSAEVKDDLCIYFNKM